MRILHNLVISISIFVYSRVGQEPRLKQWMKLEGIKENIIKSISENSDDFPVQILNFISCGLHLPIKYFEFSDWEKIIQSFYAIVIKCPIVKLPITEPSNEHSQEDNWDYPERTWNLYSHMLSSEYGWELEYISNLKVFDALALIQEILTQKQLDREFQHGLSEIAYPYNAQTKKSEFKALPRPHWMRARIMPVMKFKMPTSSLPVGNVDYDALPEELRPQPFVN